jgi:hypothetical protein
MSTDKIKPDMLETIDHIFNFQTHLKFIFLQINIKCHFGRSEVILSNKCNYFWLFESSHYHCNANVHKKKEPDSPLLLFFVNEIQLLLLGYLLLFLQFSK